MAIAACMSCSSGRGGAWDLQDAARPPLADLKADLELLHQFPLPGRL